MRRLWVRIMLIAGLVGAAAPPAARAAATGDRMLAGTGEAGFRSFAAASREPQQTGEAERASAAPAADTILSPKAGALKMDEEAQALYERVLEGDLTKAQAGIDEISRLFLAGSFKGLTSVEGVQAFSGAITDVKDALAAVQIQPDRLEAAAARLRFAADSLAHPRAPLWSQSYKLMAEDLRNLEKSAAAGDGEGWDRAVSSIQSRYSHIRAAVLISRGPSEVNAFESWLRQAANPGNGGERPERAQLLQMVSYGRDALRTLFGKEKDEPALSLPLPERTLGGWGWLAWGFIAAALIYTAWRKYRGGQKAWRPR
ncbi:sporulation protein YpjB [Paenibacillus glufosinatiresistens]|uniref:sporulation protein YpjB n=1 Tax=Paenibacillus glufosinatiresistens TaxID=3070657 RepID=UPI00286DD0E2|nr:sporulation protein YpjB [Paenibacillus sp. YX.27]